MKINAKQLTFLYFSTVAITIITLHASVFISTREDIERLYAESRLNKTSEFLMSSLESHHIHKQGQLLLQTQGKANFDPYIKVIFDEQQLPAELNIPADLPIGIAFETEETQNHKVYFVIKQNFGPGYGNAYLLLDNSFYELIEDDLLTSNATQLVFSSALLILSLLIVFKLSARLTRPISQVAEELSNRDAHNFKPIEAPAGIIPTELTQLVTSFNGFQQRINDLVERERSFNRYASHELRTPLMVMKGAISLLGESKEPEFVEKQRLRLDKATNEMNEFIQTLLSLTKLPSSNNDVKGEISEQKLQQIVDNHRYLLEGKTIDITIKINNTLYINMPEAAFNILIGNLVKNAFANTFEGAIDIMIDQQTFTISDTGVGLLDTDKTSEGFGLGLLLVKDICKQFSCQFSLRQNEIKGCTASLVFANISSS